MNNKQIIGKLNLTASLLQIQGENPFKIRGYQNTVQVIERLNESLSDLNKKEILGIEGIGKGMADKISQLIETGTFDSLDKVLENTNPVVLDLLKISGLGPKKIQVLEKEFQLNSIHDLLLLCENGKVAELKGFGKKTEEKVKSSLEYLIENKGKILYAEGESISKLIEEDLANSLEGLKFSPTGPLRRKDNSLDELSFLIACEYSEIKKLKSEINKFLYLEENVIESSPYIWRGKDVDLGIKVAFKFCESETFYSNLVIETGKEEHLFHLLENDNTLYKIAKAENFKSEVEIYEKAKLPFITPELREGKFEFDLDKKGKIELVELGDLKGCLHNHSTYSDGANTVKEMAVYCKEQGYEYFGISDHSKTAFYANGLYPEQVLKQQQEIDLLNEKLAPFKILKGIESDILPDGSLDYEEEILSTFDYIVASVHSGLDMDKEKATKRLITAIENPYTSILGHATGRLILRRKGYEIDHKKVIDACAKNNVIIEINAHPKRLDIDWQWIPYAMEKGVLISINPDAHELKGIHDMYYGVCSARKGALTKEFTFNSKSLEEVEQHFRNQKK